MKDELKLKIEGHVVINQYKSSEDLKAGNIEKCVLDQHNAIHSENMSVAVANSLGGLGNNIKYMWFGNGGCSINSLGQTIFYPSNVILQTANLYNPIYQVEIDGSDKNYFVVNHLNGNNFTDLTVNVVLDENEPINEQAVSGTGDDGVIFNEIGLFDEQNNLLTHLVFNNIEKTLTRVYTINYRLRISVF